MPLPLIPFRPMWTPPPPRMIPALTMPSFMPVLPYTSPSVHRPVNPDTFLSALFNDVLLLLNEPGNTTAFNLESGTGGSLLIGMQSAMIRWANEAAADLATTAIAVYGSETNATLPVGTTIIPYSDPLTASGDTSYVWSATDVTWNGRPLELTSRDYITTWGPLITNPAAPRYYSATPAYWYHTGTNGIGIFPSPASVSPLTMAGLVVPPRVAYTSDRPSWLMDHEAKMIVWYICQQVCLKNAANDPNLAQRAGIWGGMYQEEKSARLQRLHEINPAIANLFYARIMGTITAVTMRDKTGFVKNK